MGGVRISDWFLTLKVGVLSHVIISPFEIFEVRVEINRGQEGMMRLRIGTARTHPATNLTKRTSDEIVGQLDMNRNKSEMGRISSEILGPTFGYIR